MAKKKESTFFNMFLALVVISVTAATALAYVNSITEKPIAYAQKQKQTDALKAVLPSFESVEEKNIAVGADTLKAHYAYKNNELVGVAVESFTNKGFSGRIDLMVGFLANGNICNTQVLQHKETPGLGSKMLESPFKDQFVGKNPSTFKLSVKKDGGNVDAITAATISSRAFCDAAQRAYDAFSGNTDGTSGATTTSEEPASKNTITNLEGKSNSTLPDGTSSATPKGNPGKEVKKTDAAFGTTTETNAKAVPSKAVDATSGATTNEGGVK